jgi:hypothetical protein
MRAVGTGNETRMIDMIRIRRAIATGGCWRE